MESLRGGQIEVGVRRSREAELNHSGELPLPQLHGREGCRVLADVDELLLRDVVRQGHDEVHFDNPVNGRSVETGRLYAGK
ncbi:hypothetical protein ACFPRL_23995 [Pseudoclavibacter helvolus]